MLLTIQRLETKGQTDNAISPNSPRLTHPWLHFRARACGAAGEGPGPIAAADARRAGDEAARPSAGGGIRGGEQDPLFKEGNAYLERNYPKLDAITRATLVMPEKK
jgi:hypothetical protein